MATLTPPASHLAIDGKGIARIAGSRLRVSQIALDRYECGLAAEEIPARYPGSVTLAQVYAALAYYLDNKEAIEAEVAESDRLADGARRSTAASPLARRLREMGLL